MFYLSFPLFPCRRAYVLFVFTTIYLTEGPCFICLYPYLLVGGPMFYLSLPLFACRRVHVL
jgi:hypothetical protein